MPFPVVALVGYTNAGKSTLFNRLTEAGVMADDMLFATLDPTMRVASLPHRGKVVLSDTVGFISDLPTMLVSSFRATLEEVVSADVILHVRDIAHEDSDAQCADVGAVLQELGVDIADHARVVEVWNKADLLDQDKQSAVTNSAAHRASPPVVVSALTGLGMSALLGRVEDLLATGRPTFKVTLAPEDGKALHWLYEAGEIIERVDAPDGAVHLLVRVGQERADRLHRMFPQSVRMDGFTAATERPEIRS